MIINAQLPGGHVIFSDDLREEVKNKTSYVGVYSSELIVHGEPPGALMQLCATIFYRDTPEGLMSNPPYFRVVRITDEGSEELSRIDFNFDFSATPLPMPKADGNEPEMQVFSELRLHARMQPLKLEGPCRIAVRAYKGEDEIRLGSLRVSFQPVEEALPAAQLH